MADFFSGGAPAIGLWFLGAALLGVALLYGVVRAGWLRPHERAELDQNTLARQHSEDPKKLSGGAR